MANPKQLQRYSKKYNVLYVEDDENIRNPTRKLLEKFFNTVDVASNGNEGLNIYKEKQHDLIFSDIKMPVMNGIELVKAVKDLNPDQNIIIISAYDESAYLMELINMKVEQFLLKPVEIQNFLGVSLRVCKQMHERQNFMEKMRQDKRSLSLMKQGTFAFRTIAEAKDLSWTLANICPEPERALQGFIELFINAVEHGNLGISYKEKSQLGDQKEWEDEVTRRQALPENKDKQVLVSFQVDDETIKVHIKDKGKGFDYEQYLTIDESRIFDEHGRGIAMARMFFFDDLQYLGQGNEVRIIIHRT